MHLDLISFLLGVYCAITAGAYIAALDEGNRDVYLYIVIPFWPLIMVMTAIKRVVNAR